MCTTHSAPALDARQPGVRFRCAAAPCASQPSLASRRNESGEHQTTDAGAYASAWQAPAHRRSFIHGPRPSWPVSCAPVTTFYPGRCITRHSWSATHVGRACDATCRPGGRLAHYTCPATVRPAQDPFDSRGAVHGYPYVGSVSDSRARPGRRGHSPGHGSCHWVHVHDGNDSALILLLK